MPRCVEERLGSEASARGCGRVGLLSPLRLVRGEVYGALAPGFGWDTERAARAMNAR